MTRLTGLKKLIIKNAIHLLVMKTVFYIADYLPATVASRQAMQLVEKKLSVLKEKHVVISFQNVDFISRAFADEFIHSLSKNSIESQFADANPAITETLNTVKKNRNQRNTTWHNIAVTEINDKKQLDLMLSPDLIMFD